MSLSFFKFFLTLVLMTGSSFAAGSSQEFDEVAYSTSKALCAPLMGQGKFKQLFSNFHLFAAKSSLEETHEHILKLIQSKVGSSRNLVVSDWKTVGVLGDLLQSEGFVRAMRECFPNENDHHRFVLSLIVAEKVGNFVVIGASVFGLRLILTRFPQVLSVSYLKYYLKAALVLTTLSISSSADQKALEETREQNAKQRLSKLNERLDREALSQQERRVLEQQKQALLLEEALRLTDSNRQ